MMRIVKKNIINSEIEDGIKNNEGDVNNLNIINEETEILNDILSEK